MNRLLLLLLVLSLLLSGCAGIRRRAMKRFMNDGAPYSVSWATIEYGEAGMNQYGYATYFFEDGSIHADPLSRFDSYPVRGEEDGRYYAVLLADGTWQVVHQLGEEAETVFSGKLPWCDYILEYRNGVIYGAWEDEGYAFYEAETGKFGDAVYPDDRFSSEDGCVYYTPEHGFPVFLMNGVYVSSGWIDDRRAYVAVRSLVGNGAPSQPYVYIYSLDDGSLTPCLDAEGAQISLVWSKINEMNRLSVSETGKFIAYTDDDGFLAVQSMETGNWVYIENAHLLPSNPIITVSERLADEAE